MNLSVSHLGIDGLQDVEQIGSGGTSRVYRAHQVDLDREVAVKVINSAEDPDVARRFDRERKAMGRLSQHEGIVPVYSTGLTGNNEPYLVMAYYPNGSLQDRLDASPLAWEEAVNYVSKAATTIAAAHQEGIVHLDLKPANILLTAGDEPRIADFGIAKSTSANATARTTGTAFTPAYSAPETFLDGITSPASDVYGLGATLWALLVGYPPFLAPTDDNNLMSVIGRVVNNPVGDLRSICPAPVCEVIERAMAKRPEDRFQTASEFSAALDTAVEHARNPAAGRSPNGGLLFPDQSDDAARPDVPVVDGAITLRNSNDDARLASTSANSAPVSVPPPTPPGRRDHDVNVASASLADPGPGQAQDPYHSGLNGTDSHFDPLDGSAVGNSYDTNGYDTNGYDTTDFAPQGYGASTYEPRSSRRLLEQEERPGAVPIEPTELPESPLDRYRLLPIVLALAAVLLIALVALWAVLPDDGDTALNTEPAPPITAETEGTPSTAPGQPETADSLSVSSLTTTTSVVGDQSVSSTFRSTPTTNGGSKASRPTASTTKNSSPNSSTNSSASSTPPSVTSPPAVTAPSSSSSSSSSSTSTTAGKVKTPTGLSAEVSGGDVALSWSAPTQGPTPTGYKVYRDDVLINTVTGTSYTDPDVAAGSHSYKVSAVVRGSAGESDPSSAQLVTVDLLLTSAAGRITNDSATISIGANECLTSFRVSWIAKTTNETGTQPVTPSSCDRSFDYVITGLDSSTDYIVNVTATTKSGRTINATPLTVSTTKP